MIPPKNVVDRARRDGTIDRASQLLSAAYLLNSEAYNIVDEADDLLRAAGLGLGTIKQLHTAFDKAATRYFREFADMIRASGKGMEYFEDLDAFDKAFRKWAKLDTPEDRKEVQP